MLEALERSEGMRVERPMDANIDILFDRLVVIGQHILDLLE